MRTIELSERVDQSIRRALDEDIGPGDATTDSIIPADASLRGQIVAKQSGVVAGLEVARRVFLQLSEQVNFEVKVEEGAQVEKRTVLVDLYGPARALLTGERTALNFLGRMSGIATLTREYMDAVKGTKAIILDTRKTAPGLRETDKLAVRLGGGENHRIGLFDMVLIKDNHIDFAGSITAAVRRVRERVSDLEIEVETRTLDDVREALELGVERILLDNMSAEMMRQAVAINDGRAKLEASGNVTIENVRQVAETGVDYISVGALTHSVKVFDVSLEWIGGH
ncbi:MAG TPA: carboxylating nicotinate-nucleotide diphosphorylase [Pyrinomonadaceae bacterium]|jgi:nicotinate-nucleotide pyrophosphorylase (carboxylating)|nr:carboxylating nicotinate-nucleotide diphosphorylase [Pyrinomonadaceae bacterium]